MVIDTHIHPALFAPICEDQERFRRRCDAMNYHLMKPSDMALLRKQYALADIGRVVLLPEDCSVESGMVEISNDEIAKLVALDAQFYIGMATVDPRRPDAVQELERAFAELGLAGLAVNTARLKMYPMDERLVPLYDLCRKYHKPIIFHAGFCLEITRWQSMPARWNSRRWRCAGRRSISALLISAGRGCRRRRLCCSSIPISTQTLH